MEKKTIGKFIAVLRKAHGMTQKELGDRLYVSDKTVSRWERDECTPELALIPVIAEIFGITTDELLRGERNSSAVPTGEGVTPEAAAESAAYQKKKSDKQWKSLLHRRMTTYKNLTYLSVGLPIVGLLGAAIANLAFTRGLVGFCIAAVFILAGVICQLCFAANAKMPVDDDEDDTTRTADLATFNDRVVGTAVKVLFLDLALLAFCLPIMPYSHMGLTMGFWLWQGALCAICALVVGWAIYAFGIRPALIRGGALSPESEDTVTRRRVWYKTLRRYVIVGAVIAVVPCIVAGVIIELPRSWFAKRIVFEDRVEFQTYMEDAWKSYQSEQDPQWDEYGFSVNVEIQEETMSPSIKFDDDFEYIESGDYVEVTEDGNVLFTYVHVPGYVVEFSFDKSDDGLPIKVYTRESLDHTYAVLEVIFTATLVLAAVEALVVTLLLVRKRKKIFTT